MARTRRLNPFWHLGRWACRKAGANVLDIFRIMRWEAEHGLPPDKLRETHLGATLELRLNLARTLWEIGRALGYKEGIDGGQCGECK
jgi:hypothetical protein